MIQGFAIPALTTRRAAATLELKSGQSFAMAGLLSSTDAAVTSRIPGLGDLPVIGPLFRSVRYRNEETELVILVTASLVEPMSVASAPPLPGIAHQAPNDWEFYVEGRIESKEPARIDPDSQKWLQDMGLDQLVGPGAWDTYEDKSYSESARSAEANREAAKAGQIAQDATAAGMRRTCSRVLGQKGLMPAGGCDTLAQGCSRHSGQGRSERKHSTMKSADVLVLTTDQETVAAVRDAVKSGALRGVDERL